MVVVNGFVFHVLVFALGMLFPVSFGECIPIHEKEFVLYYGVDYIKKGSYYNYFCILFHVLIYYTVKYYT